MFAVECDRCGHWVNDSVQVGGECLCIECVLQELENAKIKLYRWELFYSILGYDFCDGTKVGVERAADIAGVSRETKGEKR